MKTYNIFITAAIALFTLGSCSNFLTTELTDQKTSDSYYKTPSDAYTALVGCYNGLNLIWSDNSYAFPVASEVYSDNCFGGTGTSDGHDYDVLDQFDITLAPSYVSLYENDWKRYYQAIYRCNELLDKLDQVEWGSSSSLKNQYEAEAKFLRAFFYFDLVRLFEKVPLITTPTSELVAQADPADIYKQIMSDLRFAINNMPTTAYSSSSTTVGRATKWAAESLLARVYLFYSGYYSATSIGDETSATALAAVEDVISNSGHDLLADFTTLWPAASVAKGVTYAGEDNKEVVFAIKYTGNGTSTNNNITGNKWLIMEGIRNNGVGIYPYGYGWGACTVDPKLVAQFDKTNDSRYFASITSINDEKLAFSNSSDCREYTGYYLKKYSPQSDVDNNSLPTTDYQYAQAQDYYVIRYADVLLMAAELGSTNAATYYNKVHQRAIPTAATVSSVTKSDILAERRLEFVGEGIRYWDLLRQGLATAASTIANNTTWTVATGTPSVTKITTNITTTRGFQQIPADEITLSGGVLKQNAGW
jgi:starch-binding outer membrane protein, SusD/RagB family